MNRESFVRLSKTILLLFCLLAAFSATTGCSLKPGPGSNESFADRKVDDRNLDLSQEDMAKAYNDQNHAENEMAAKQFSGDSGGPGAPR